MPSRRALALMHSSGIEDRVNHRTQIGGSRSAPSFRRRQKRRDQRPLAIRQVAWITPRHPVYAQHERHHSKASGLSICSTKTEKHKSLISLNFFSVRLLGPGGGTLIRKHRSSRAGTSPRSFTPTLDRPHWRGKSLLWLPPLVQEVLVRLVM